jgi:hypothetical protein
MLTADTYSLISFSAFSTVSEPWQMLRPTASAKSPRMVPKPVDEIGYTSSTNPALFTRSGCQRVRGTEHSTASLDGFQTLPDHAHDGTRSHVLDESWEEGFLAQIKVVCVAGINEDPCF